jgi:putative NIF3 family GTP cyclohydrolase 1 type 2
MPTVQAMIDDILTTIPGAPFPETVDVLKAGDPAQEVTGVVTTFLGTQAILQKAIDLGANFIISHEPVYYNHLDKTDWLQNDPVYRAKRKLIDDHGLAIWRFHDYWHSHQPDGIKTGMLQALNWSQAYDPNLAYLKLPPIALGDLMATLKDKLGCQRGQMVGRPDTLCSKIAFVSGSPGIEYQMEILHSDVDVMIIGEINEWQTPEYIRDAQTQGLSKALIVLGHEASEEAGMAYLVEWLRPKYPDLNITHVPSGDPYAPQ